MQRNPEAASSLPIHVMAKPTGAVCNLDCSYCFYLEKERLYPGSDFRMSEDTLERYIRNVLAAHHGQPQVVVAFQGGEPTLMGLDFFRRVLEIEASTVQPGQQILNTLQTNATLIDDEWAAFLAGHGFLVGVSIDGPRELHDAYRVDKGGKPTFDRVMAGLDALRRHRADWNALVTVNSANESRGRDVYRFLRDELAAEFVQLIPIVDHVGASVVPYSVSPGGYGRFLVDVFDEWVRHDVGTVFVQAFDTALAHWLGLEGVGVCVHERTCGRAVALEHNGDVYACDHFVDDEHWIGSLSGGRTLLQLVESEQQRAFGRAKLDTLPSTCRACDVRFACNGGCPKDRLVPAPGGEPGLNYLCEGYQLFFRHIDGPMRYMADRCRSGGEAGDVMGWMARRDTVPVPVEMGALT